MKFSNLFAACLACAAAVLDAAVFRNPQPSSTQYGVLSAHLRGASEKTAAATDSASKADTAVMLNRKSDSAAKASNTAIKADSKVNSTACVNSTSGKPCGTQTEHHPCTGSSPCGADKDGPCSSKLSPCKERVQGQHRPPLPRGHFYYAKQCSDCYYRHNQCGCEPALELMACLTKFCYEPNTAAFAETCANLSNKCYDQMELKCHNGHTYCKSKWNQLPVGGLGLTVKVNEDDAYCGPSGKCLGNLLFTTKIVNLPHPPQGCQPKAYAVNYTDGGCKDNHVYNNKSNTLLWSGVAGDEDQCQAKCDGDDRCSFFSFCPRGTAGCTGVNENKCATFRECKDYLKHPGFTTYERNPDTWHNENVRPWGPPCMNLAGVYTIANDGSTVHLKQSGCAGKGVWNSGHGPQHFLYTTVSNNVTMTFAPGSPLGQATVNAMAGLVSQEGTKTTIDLHGKQTQLVRDQCPEPIWVECGLPRTENPKYGKKHDWHICEVKAEGDVANCSLHLPKNWVQKDACDEVYCALKDGRFGKAKTEPQWYEICNMYGKRPKAAKIVIPATTPKPKLVPAPPPRPPVVQEEPCDPCTRPCPGVNFHAEKVDCDKPKKASVNFKAEKTEKPKETKKSKSLSWWVSKDDKKDEKARPTVAFR